MYSLRALHQIYHGSDDACELARKATETAIEFDIYCGKPIDVFEDGKKK